MNTLMLCTIPFVCLFVCLSPYPDAKGHARGPKASYLPLELDTAKKRPCAAFHLSCTIPLNVIEDIVVVTFESHAFTLILLANFVP